MEASKLGLYFEEFEVGGKIQHSLSKTIFESDNNFFSLLQNKSNLSKIVYIMI